MTTPTTLREIMNLNDAMFPSKAIKMESIGSQFGRSTLIRIDLDSGTLLVSPEKDNEGNCYLDIVKPQKVKVKEE